MADIDNGHGEMMPDWVQFPVQNPPILFAPNMPLTDGGDHNTAQPSPPVFAYLDVGRWGGDLPGGQRCFGLVWARWVALCEFLPGSGPPAKITDWDSPIDRVLDALKYGNHHVLVRKSLWSISPVADPDPNTVWVIIGDLHLPIRTASTRPAMRLKTGNLNWHFGFDSSRGGRITILEDIDNPEDRNGRQGFDPTNSGIVQRWYANYSASDIFQSAEDDLVEFLQSIDQVDIPNGSINVLQIGDMYELWNGLDRYWLELTAGEGVTPLPNRDADGMAAWDVVKFWVSETNRAFPNLVKMLNDQGAHSRFFLYGNHDCYLKAGALDPPILGLPVRRQFIHQGGIFIEHGQSGDDFNRDGASKGYLITQANFVVKNQLRNLEDPARKLIGSDKRKVFIARAANLFAGNSNFCVYAMGHTHSPMLTMVRLVRAAQP